MHGTGLSDTESELLQLIIYDSTVEDHTIESINKYLSLQASMVNILLAMINHWQFLYPAPPSNYYLYRL